MSAEIQRPVRSVRPPRLSYREDPALDQPEMIVEALCEIEKPVAAPPAVVEGKVVAVVHSSAAPMMAQRNLAVLSA
jgi:hypothetical protein